MADCTGRSDATLTQLDLVELIRKTTLNETIPSFSTEPPLASKNKSDFVQLGDSVFTFQSRFTMPTMGKWMEKYSRLYGRHSRRSASTEPNHPKTLDEEAKASYELAKFTFVPPFWTFQFPLVETFHRSTEGLGASVLLLREEFLNAIKEQTDVPQFIRKDRAYISLPTRDNRAGTATQVEISGVRQGSLLDRALYTFGGCITPLAGGSGGAEENSASINFQEIRRWMMMERWTPSNFTINMNHFFEPRTVRITPNKARINEDALAKVLHKPDLKYFCFDNSATSDPLAILSSMCLSKHRLRKAFPTAFTRYGPNQWGVNKHVADIIKPGKDYFPEHYKRQWSQEYPDTHEIFLPSREDLEAYGVWLINGTSFSDELKESDVHPVGPNDLKGARIGPNLDWFYRIGIFTDLDIIEMFATMHEPEKPEPMLPGGFRTSDVYKEWIDLCQIFTMKIWQELGKGEEDWLELWSTAEKASSNIEHSASSGPQSQR